MLVVYAYTLLYDIICVTIPYHSAQRNNPLTPFTPLAPLILLIPLYTLYTPYTPIISYSPLYTPILPYIPLYPPIHHYTPTYTRLSGTALGNVTLTGMLDHAKMDQAMEAIPDALITYRKGLLKIKEVGARE